MRVMQGETAVAEKKPKEKKAKEEAPPPAAVRCLRNLGVESACFDLSIEMPV